MPTTAAAQGWLAGMVADTQSAVAEQCQVDDRFIDPKRRAVTPLEADA